MTEFINSNHNYNFIICILPTVEFLWVFFSHDVESVCNGSILRRETEKKAGHFRILLSYGNKDKKVNE